MNGPSLCDWSCERVVVAPRAAVERVLAAVMVAYESAVAGADLGELDFSEFETLGDAVQTLRTLLDEPRTAGEVSA
jgi:hypothetical protein